MWRMIGFRSSFPTYLISQVAVAGFQIAHPQIPPPPPPPPKKSTNTPHLKKCSIRSFIHLIYPPSLTTIARGGGTNHRIGSKKMGKRYVRVRFVSRIFPDAISNQAPCFVQGSSDSSPIDPSPICGFRLLPVSLACCCRFRHLPGSLPCRRFLDFVSSYLV